MPIQAVADEDVCTSSPGRANSVSAVEHERRARTIHRAVLAARSSNPDLRKNDFKESTTPHCVRQRTLPSGIPDGRRIAAHLIIWGPADEVVRTRRRNL